MLSGGMDSGSIVAVASKLLKEKGLGPLPTFSAVGPNPATCIETRTVHAALAMDGLNPHLVNRKDLNELLPELVELNWALDEPFDNHMTLVRAIYLAAHRNKVKAVLDGIDADTILSEGSHIVRLLRRGKWLAAYREARGQETFWDGAYPAGQELFRSACRAFVPGPVLQLRRTLRNRSLQNRQLKKNIQESIISQKFADQVHLGERLQTLQMHRLSEHHSQPGQESATIMNHPGLTVGLERYNRVASALAIEPRHPFLDRRMVEFCMALPCAQKLNQGWPKAILRRSMAGRLPDGVRWRRGKEHLGWAFTTGLMETMQDKIQLAIKSNIDTLFPYLDKDRLNHACKSYFDGNDPDQAGKIYEAAHLALWLKRHKERPQVESNRYDTPFHSITSKEKMHVAGKR
jgi:asparagine synthase (glutamine-hydrolysing)